MMTSSEDESNEESSDEESKLAVVLESTEESQTNLEDEASSTLEPNPTKSILEPSAVCKPNIFLRRI